MNYKINTLANLPHLNQVYSSNLDCHPIFGNIGGWVCDKTTMDFKYKLDRLDWSKKIDGTPSDLTGVDGDVMVKIPAFYYRVTMQDNRQPIIEIDNTIPDLYGSNCKPGFKVHPAFVKNNGEIRPYFLWGAYKGHLEGSILRSISGVLPSTSKTKGAFQDSARQGRTIDFGISAVYERWAIQMLFYVEFGSLNSQDVCGLGIVNMTWDEGATTNPDIRKTGGSNALGDRSGYIDNGNGNGKSSVRYRGIEDLWGNVWDFISGIMVTDQGWHYTNDHTKMDNIPQMSLYSKDLTQKQNNGYVSEMEYPNGLEWTFIPKTAIGNYLTYYCDYLYTHNPGQENIVLAGGRWSYGAYAGLACWCCNYVPADSSSAIGARLSYARQ